MEKDIDFMDKEYTYPGELNRSLLDLQKSKAASDGAWTRITYPATTISIGKTRVDSLENYLTILLDKVERIEQALRVNGVPGDEKVEFTYGSVRDFIDSNIVYWRKRYSSAKADNDIRIAACYVDAYQHIRRAIYGEALPHVIGGYTTGAEVN